MKNYRELSLKELEEELNIEAGKLTRAEADYYRSRAVILEISWSIDNFVSPDKMADV